MDRVRKGPTDSPVLSPRVSGLNPIGSPRIGSPRIGSPRVGSPRTTSIASSPSSSPGLSSGSGGAMSRVEKVIQELVQSEATYIQDLALVIQIYLTPLRGSTASSPRDEDSVADLLTHQEINTIFSNVEQVLGVNTALFEEMDQDRSVSCVAAALTKMSQYLKVYSIYCSNQESALKLVEDLEKKNARFAKWLKTNQSKMLSRGLDLRDFLIKPTQRICKYPLFLRELIDNAGGDSAIQKQLQEVNAQIQAVVSHINEQRRLKQGLDGVAEVFQKLATDFPLVTAQRVLVYRGIGPVKELVPSSSSAGTSSSNLLSFITTASSPSSSGPIPMLGVSPPLSTEELPQPFPPPLIHSTSQPAAQDEEQRKGSLSILAEGLKRMSRRGSRAESPSNSGSSGGLQLPGGRSVSSSGSMIGSRRGSVVNSSTEGVVDLVTQNKEAHLFLFNDLFLYCRPCRSLGKKGLLDIVLDVPADRIRVKVASYPDCFKVRLLKDGAEGLTTKYFFQCRDSLELDGWMEAFDKMNPFAPIRRKISDPKSLVISLEIEAVKGKLKNVRTQMTLLTEKLRVIQLKTQKVDDGNAATAEQLEESVNKLRAMAYSLPQWKYQAKEAKDFCESICAWLDGLAPHAKFARKMSEDVGDAGAPVLVSLRKVQQMMKEQQDQRRSDSASSSTAAGEASPPPVPPRDDDDVDGGGGDPNDEDLYDYVEEEQDDDLDVDKLGAVLRSVSGSPATVSGVDPSTVASPGPGRKMRRRMVKVKVKRKKKKAKNGAAAPPKTPVSPAAAKILKVERAERRMSQSAPTSPRGSPEQVRVPGSVKYAGNNNAAGMATPPKRAPPLPPMSSASATSLNSSMNGGMSLSTSKAEESVAARDENVVDLSDLVKDERQAANALLLTAEELVTGYGKMKRDLAMKIEGLERLGVANKSK